MRLMTQLSCCLTQEGVMKDRTNIPWRVNAVNKNLPRVQCAFVYAQYGILCCFPLYLPSFNNLVTFALRCYEAPYFFLEFSNFLCLVRDHHLLIILQQTRCCLVILPIHWVLWLQVVYLSFSWVLRLRIIPIDDHVWVRLLATKDPV